MHIFVDLKCPIMDLFLIEYCVASRYSSEKGSDDIYPVTKCFEWKKNMFEREMSRVINVYFSTVYDLLQGTESRDTARTDSY